jgi:DNA gyrase inhibitor GyrI
MEGLGPADFTALVVERDEAPVMFLRVRDQPEEIHRGWEQFESLLGSLKGRKFFGAVAGDGSDYLVCAQLREGDDPAALELESGTLPGGTYLRARLRGEPPGVYERIAPKFDALERTAQRDTSRPCIEFYRRRDEIDLFMPVRSAAKLQPSQREE